MSAHQHKKAGGNGSAGLTTKRNQMTQHLILLLPIVVIVTVKVKIIIKKR